VHRAYLFKHPLSPCTHYQHTHNLNAEMVYVFSNIVIHKDHDNDLDLIDRSFGFNSAVGAAQVTLLPSMYTLPTHTQPKRRDG